MMINYNTERVQAPRRSKVIRFVD